MKALHIGRDENSDIYLDDTMVSRRHAILKLYPSGKNEIIDLSANGTFVNGTRIPSNKPVRVKRSDVVSFAQTRLLDWKDVPDLSKPYKIAGASIAVVFIGLILTTLIISWSRSCSRERTYTYDYPETEVVDQSSSATTPQATEAPSQGDAQTKLPKGKLDIPAVPKEKPKAQPKAKQTPAEKTQEAPSTDAAVDDAPATETPTEEPAGVGTIL